MTDIHALPEEISRLTGIPGITMSLTDHGSDVASQLGPVWFARAVRTLRLAHRDKSLELVLAVAENEPLPRPHPIQPATAGGMYGEGRAVGRISVPGSTDGGALGRVLVLPSAAVLREEGGFEFIASTSRARRIAGAVYRTAYQRTPLLLDRWRQGRNSRVVGRRSEFRTISPALHSSAPGRVRADGGSPTVWMALHWFETGGAESWAFDAVRLAKEAGYEVVITADVPAPQRLLDKALALTHHVYTPGNVLAEEDWGNFFQGLVAEHAPEVVHLHHSGRAYGFLPELRHLLPGVYVLDSTHIVEHRTGGFVRTSIEYSHHIDEHHVISPELRDLYLLDARVDSSKVHYHPLTQPAGSPAEHRPVHRDGPLRIGFLGRLAAQKRPFLFVELVRRLHAAHPGRFEFVMQGSGALGGLTSVQIAREGLSDVVARKAWGPVDEFFSEIDVLVISSDNEGLTLTTLEAEQHGVLVLSSDVGSQRTVIAPELLVPREPRQFLDGACAALVSLASSPDAFERAQLAQAELVASLRAVEPASAFLSRTLTSLKESS